MRVESSGYTTPPIRTPRSEGTPPLLVYMEDENQDTSEVRDSLDICLEYQSAGWDVEGHGNFVFLSAVHMKARRSLLDVVISN